MHVAGIDRRGAYRRRDVPTRTYSPRRPEATVLHRSVRENLETFLVRARDQERPVPKFVEREFRAFLDCGVLACGFLRVHCDVCGRDRLVPFSCKGRGFCPSCGGRRMADTAARLVEAVLPRAPVRQWVLTLPFALRYRLAFDAELTAAVLSLFIRALFASLRRRARRRGWRSRLRCGAVTFIQRFGDALNLNVHFHTLALDGVYAAASPEGERFVPLPPPGRGDVERVARRVQKGLLRLLESRGLGAGADPTLADPLSAEDPFLALLASASVRGRIAAGKRAGQQLLRFGDEIDPEETGRSASPRCVALGGLSIHAEVAVPARDRRRLERLCRYAGRAPLANRRLSLLPDGRLLYRLKRRWRDGTTHVIFGPLELLERLAVLVPPPRIHQVRYHGLLGPAALRRSQIVPGGRLPNSHRTDLCAHPTRREASMPPPPSPPASLLPSHADDRGGQGQDLPRDAPIPPSPRFPQTPQGRSFPSAGRPPDAFGRSLPWAELLKRVFAVDVLGCPRCGGRMRILAAIQTPEAIRAILDHLGLPSRAPPLAPARPQAESDTGLPSDIDPPDA